MKRKYMVTGLGVAILSVGMIGGVLSGVNAIPTLVNKKQVIDNKYNEKEVIFNEVHDVSQLNINLQKSDVVLRKHDSDKILIERTGAKDITNLRCEKGDGILTLSEDYKDAPEKEIKSIDDIVKSVVDDAFSSHISEVTIYLPKEVNVNVSEDSGYLRVDDDVILDSLTYKTNVGSIQLNEYVEFENLNVTSVNGVSISGSEMLGIKNVKLEGRSIYVHSSEYELSTEELLAKIPDVLEIKCSSPYGYEGVTIETNMPVAKNVNIQTTSTVDVNLPLLEYKFNFDIKTNKGINFSHMQNDERYYNTSLEKLFNSNNSEFNYDSELQTEEGFEKEYKGVLNEDLKDEQTEYTFNIKASDVMFR